MDVADFQRLPVEQWPPDWVEVDPGVEPEGCRCPHERGVNRNREPKRFSADTDFCWIVTMVVDVVDLASLDPRADQVFCEHWCVYGDEGGVVTRVEPGERSSYDLSN